MGGAASTSCFLQEALRGPKPSEPIRILRTGSVKETRTGRRLPTGRCSNSVNCQGVGRLYVQRLPTRAILATRLGRPGSRCAESGSAAVSTEMLGRADPGRGSAAPKPQHRCHGLSVLPTSYKNFRAPSAPEGATVTRLTLSLPGVIGTPADRHRAGLQLGLANS